MGFLCRGGMRDSINLTAVVRFTSDICTISRTVLYKNPPGWKDNRMKIIKHICSNVFIRVTTLNKKLV